MLLNQIENDLILWNRFREGDTASFVKIFKIYYSQLFNYGSKICEDITLVEDSIQELFIDLWRTKGKAEILSLQSYLFKAFKFKLIKALTKASKITSFSSQLPAYEFEISHELFIISNDENKELSQKVFNAMKELSPRQKEVIYLKFNQNLNYEEVSEIMHINYQAARNLVYTSIKVLKKLIVV
ncbi:MAG: sigma-70 family RNA polymerase sigma factor [Ginsengibacter sp.]